MIECHAKYQCRLMSERMNNAVQRCTMGFSFLLVLSLSYFLPAVALGNRSTSKRHCIVNAVGSRQEDNLSVRHGLTVIQLWLLSRTALVVERKRERIRSYIQALLLGSSLIRSSLHCLSRTLGIGRRIREAHIIGQTDRSEWNKRVSSDDSLLPSADV